MNIDAQRLICTMMYHLHAFYRVFNIRHGSCNYCPYYEKHYK